MTSNRILSLLLLLQISVGATSVGATKVQQLTFSGGLGQSCQGTQCAKLIMGQPFSGRTINYESSHQAKFGFWNIWSTLEIVLASENDIPGLTTKFFNNYPNPFNPSTRIPFSLEKEKFVSIDVYDLRGRKVDSIFAGIKPQGKHIITYQPLNLASGSYVILMKTDSFRATQSMMLLK